MALRTAPKRKVDLQELDNLQKEIFGTQTEEVTNTSVSQNNKHSSNQEIPQKKPKLVESIARVPGDNKRKPQISAKPNENINKSSVRTKSSPVSDNSAAFGANLTDMETIAANIASSKAGQGRNTTRPFSIPRTLIIDTTRLKAKFRTIDEQFTQNIIIDFLLREALAAATPANYRNLRAEAFEFIKRAEETTRRSLTITEEVIYQMSELKAGINLETGKKYSNDEIFSTLLAIGVSWLYRQGILN
ncbi:MAG TPA: hypothetical protein PKY82_03960 [Pyrinomonadaceae bacterium]|nr:hypothetical protein [Pyrinomonadaceae bacterium]